MSKFIECKSPNVPVSIRLILILCAIMSGLARPVSAADDNQNGMDDAYEQFFGLMDIPDAASQDFDGDGLSNLEESRLWTDPWMQDTDLDGIPDNEDGNPVSRAVIYWGDPLLTLGNECFYTWPSWMLGAGKDGGDWLTPSNAASSWHVASDATTNTGSLHMDMDRSILTNNLRLDLDYFDHTNAAIYVDLIDTNNSIIATNLFGNLLLGHEVATNRILNIPLGSYGNASGILIRRVLGESTVYSTVLYVDEDGDGLDAEREVQLGTSDFDVDNDGLPDWWETLYFSNQTSQSGTDDFDHDGFVNRVEYLRGTNPTNPVNAFVILVWTGVTAGAWSDARWTNSPPAYPTALEDALLRTNALITVNGNQAVNFLVISKGEVRIAANSVLSPYSVAVSNGILSCVDNGYLTSANTSTTAGKFAYELYAGTNSAVLTGDNASLRKWSTGLGVLSGVNTYSGWTQLDSGILRATDGIGLPTGSLLRFNGGILQTTGLFSRVTGTTPGRVTWAASGGFAAYGAPLIVTLDNGAKLNWGDTSGLNGKALLLGSTTADALTEFRNALDLKGNRAVQVDDNTATTNDLVRMTGILANGDGSARVFTKSGTGILELTATNTYSGATVISGGLLRALEGIGFSPNSQIQISGGILETCGTLTRSVGNVSGAVYWVNNGGFSARGGTLILDLANAAVLNWTSVSNGFNGKSLSFQSPYADSEVRLANPIELRGDRTISVDNNINTTADLAILSGTLSDGDATARKLTKTGGGVLVLSGTNTYSGATIMTAGQLRADDGVGLPTNGLLQINGGVLESKGTLTRSIANTNGAVYWNNNGGFSAFGGVLVVNLAGGAILNWTSPTNGFNGKTLIMGSETADNIVEIRNPVELRASRTIQVNDNTGTTADLVRFTGGIANGDTTARALTKTGNGLLELAGTNTFTGATTVSAGELRVSGVATGSAVTVNNAGSTLSGTGLVKGATINSGAILAPGNGGVGTLSSTGAVSLANGAIYEWELASSGADSMSVTGNVTLTSGWKLRLKDMGGSSVASNQWTLFKYTGTATLGAYTIDTNLVFLNYNWFTTNIVVTNDTVGKRIYLTGLTASPNQPPVAVDDTYSADEDTTLNVSAPGLLANDTDPEGGNLTAQLFAGITGLTFNANGSFTYTPPANWNGTTSFTYRVWDGLTNSAPATVTISVNPVNNAPTCDAGTNQNVTAATNGYAVTTLSGSGSDMDGAIAIWSWFANNAQIATGQTATASLPVGTNLVSLVVTDNGGLSATDTVTIVVEHAPNQPPVATDSAYTVDEDTILTIPTPGVLTNAYDFEGSNLTAKLVARIPGLTFYTSGAFTYTPPANWNGTTSFTFCARDGLTNSATATVTITVNPVNDAPVCDAGGNQILAANTNGPTSVTLSGAQSHDVDGTITNWTWSTNGTSFASGENASVTWPNGLYYVTLTITDDGGLTVTNTVRIAILDNPDGDDDNDGLPNGWEILYGLDPSDATGDNGATGNPDGDDADNLTEYLQGRDPTKDFESDVDGKLNLQVFTTLE